jgi:hypothetical protein
MIICTSYSGIALAEPLRRPAGTSADRGRDHHIEDRPGRRKYPFGELKGGFSSPAYHAPGRLVVPFASQFQQPEGRIQREIDEYSERSMPLCHASA